MKKTQMSFLQKFSGKTSKINKQGIVGLLLENKPIEIPNAESDLSTRQQAKKRPSLYRDIGEYSGSAVSNRQPQINLDELIPSIPKSKMPPKSSIDQTRKISNISKSDYVPSFIPNSIRNTKLIIPHENEQITRKTNKILESPLIKEQYQRTRHSSTSSKTTNYGKISKKQNNSYGLSEYNAQPKGFGFAYQLSGDAAKHLEFLNSIEQKFSSKE